MSQIPRLAEHGTLLTTGTNVAQQRGSGNWELPGRWEQSTDRGYAWQNAYPMYVDQYNKEISVKMSYMQISQ